MKIILASQSPRRHELLATLGLPFETLPVDVNEAFPDDVDVKYLAELLSEKKNRAARIKVPAALIISADTVVVLQGKAMGKPKDQQEAYQMLSRLSGQIHEVITGVTLTSPRQKISFSVTTRVKFGFLSTEEINYYISRFQPFDKAAAYGIQEWIGQVGVEWIEGSYYNVVGLPVHEVYRHLKEDFYVVVP